MKTVLTIAGSDPSGGAGIQADIKTMTVHGVYAMSAITALTAQNTMGVYGILESTPEFLKKQIDAVFTDIRPDAVKIGMVSSPALAEVICERLSFYKAENIVIDPVMISTSGTNLSKKNVAELLINNLSSISTIITPNIPEAEAISKMEIKTEADMITAAEKIAFLSNVSVLIKGGHRNIDSNDLLYENGRIVWFQGKHIDNPNTHGTGCTLSSAIASNLAKGMDVETSVKKAKEYITKCISLNLNLGKGSGPLNHITEQGAKNL